jgi:hypothetical protein
MSKNEDILYVNESEVLRMRKKQKEYEREQLLPENIKTIGM